MPEAAVDEDDPAPPGEDPVGGAGQVAAVQAEAVAECVAPAAHGELGAGVLAANAGHAFGAGRGRKRIHQSTARCVTVPTVSADGPPAGHHSRQKQTFTTLDPDLHLSLSLGVNSSKLHQYQRSSSAKRRR